mmetsp:Transcript_71142/g.231042  ORF Transcript_71142/g.231042 Transcript_71142/m.231042 type:complete len:214 (-) Transcript_71142:8540-9181(-)
MAFCRFKSGVSNFLNANCNSWFASKTSLQPNFRASNLSETSLWYNISGTNLSGSMGLTCALSKKCIILSLCSRVMSARGTLKGQKNIAFSTTKLFRKTLSFCSCFVHLSHFSSMLSSWVKISCKMLRRAEHVALARWASPVSSKICSKIFSSPAPMPAARAAASFWKSKRVDCLKNATVLITWQMRSTQFSNTSVRASTSRVDCKMKGTSLSL